MSLNETDPIIRGAKAVDTYPGMANPTSSSNPNTLEANFMTDPTTPSRGAGAGPGFKGHEDAARALKPAAGVVEARPGIIESTNIDPLNENSNKDDGWANATEIQGRKTRSTGVLDTASDAVQQASTVATGAAKLAYGHLAGDEQAKAGGREAVYGKPG